MNEFAERRLCDRLAKYLNISQVFDNCLLLYNAFCDWHRCMKSQVTISSRGSGRGEERVAKSDGAMIQFVLIT